MPVVVVTAPPLKMLLPLMPKKYSVARSVTDYRDPVKTFTSSNILQMQKSSWKKPKKVYALLPKI
jgi:hypothetical protein